MSSQKKQQTDNRLRVGSQVYFVFGRSVMKGIITEDRGAIGAGGRRLFRVEAPFGPDEPPLIGEFPAEALQPA